MVAPEQQADDEVGRLLALAEADLDASFDPVLDGLVRVVALQLGAPVSSLNVVDERRQWVKAAVGAELGSGPDRADSFCTHVVGGDRPVVVEDARQDPVLAGKPGVVAGEIRAYAGVPLRTEDGHVLGSLCVWGPEPRGFSAGDLEVLESLAAAATGHLELRRRSRQLAAASAKLQAVLEHAPDAFIAMDGDGIVRDWNREAERMFGWTRAEAVGRTVAELIVPAELRGRHAGGLARYRSTGSLTVLNRPVEVPAVRRDGSTIDVELRIAAVPGAANEEHFNAFARDISERKALEAEQQRLVARLEQLSRTDPLTGAANRAVLAEEVEREIARARRTGAPLSAILLDLDHFKAYNDEHGHQAGDRLLVGAVHAWQRLLRATDVLARYGGEEFVVLLPGCPDEDAAAIAERLNEVIPDGRSCSAGVARWAGDETGEQLLARADAALYAAKAAGRSRVVCAPVLV